MRGNTGGDACKLAADTQGMHPPGALNAAHQVFHAMRIYAPCALLRASHLARLPFVPTAASPTQHIQCAPQRVQVCVSGENANSMQG
eukprot:365019-Chlamydomonas_euryale.AAC.16